MILMTVVNTIVIQGANSLQSGKDGCRMTRNLAQQNWRENTVPKILNRATKHYIISPP